MVLTGAFAVVNVFAQMHQTLARKNVLSAEIYLPQLNRLTQLTEHLSFVLKNATEKAKRMVKKDLV